MDFPILYSFRRCPYAIRARLAILAAGMVCELREVSLANKPEAMLRASPKATIPVLVLPDGRVLDESLDIMRYALSHNDPGLWMGPTTQSALGLVALNDDVFKKHLDGYKYPENHAGKPTKHRDCGFLILSQLDALLAHHRFLAGEDCSLTDIAIFPFVRQFAAVNEAWFADQPIPHLRAWLAGLLISDGFKAVMATWRIWQPGDEVIHFPCSQATV